MDGTIHDAGSLADDYLAFVERLLKFTIGSLLCSLLVVLFWRLRNTGGGDGE